MCDGPDDLAAKLHRAALVDGHLLDTSSDPIPSLEDDDVRSAGDEVAGSREAGEPRSEDDHVRHGVSTSSGARTRSASGGKCAVTLAPTSNSSTSSAFATSACRRSPPGSVTYTWVVEPR